MLGKSMAKLYWRVKKNGNGTGLHSTMKTPTRWTIYSSTWRVIVSAETVNDVYSFEHPLDLP
jgi:hypothetical protein